MARPVSWTELRIEATREQADTLETLLREENAEAITFQDAGDDPVYEPDPETTRLWDTLILTALFPEDQDLSRLLLQLDLLKHAGGLQAWHLSSLKNQAWERVCLQDFHPIRAGKRLWICPSWETLPPDPNAITVTLDPGLAFGTGTHPTTAMCLAWLDAHLEPGTDVIDYGCGSGILSLAAIKLGARHVTAIDHDTQAVESTKENASRNHLPPAQLTAGLPDTLPPDKADLIIANILAAPLIQLAPLFASHLRSGGQLALSGILETQSASVIEAYAPWFSLQPHDKSGGWVCLAGFRLQTVDPHNI